jgi:hypothetical protein
MRIGFCGVPHRLIVLAAVFGISLTSPATSQPAATFDVVEATIDSIHAAMRSGGLTCTKLVQSYLERIAAYDQAGPKLNAVQNINPLARQQAADFDAKFKASGEIAPLGCVPVLLKDQIETDFMPTTYGSAMFKTFVPKRNATVVERLPAPSSWRRRIWESSRRGVLAPPSVTVTTRMIPLISPVDRPAALASAWRRTMVRSGLARTREVQYADRHRTQASSGCAQRPRW